MLHVIHITFPYNFHKICGKIKEIHFGSYKACVLCVALMLKGVYMLARIY